MFDRRLCSLKVYHCDDSSAKAGILEASKRPKKNRTAIAPLKFDTREKRARMIPQRTIQVPVYLARGRACINRFVGYYKRSVVALTKPVAEFLQLFRTDLPN